MSVVSDVQPVAMTFQLAETLSGPVTAVIASWLTYRFGSRQARSDGQRMIRASVASDLYVPLRELQSVLRKHGRVAISVADVAYAFRSFFDAFDRERHRLPDDWAHLGKNVRAAAGTALGGVSFVDLDPSAEFCELAEPNNKWRDFADDYIDYVVHRLMCWGDSRSATKADLLSFDPWLLRTGRVDPPLPGRRTIFGRA